MKLFGFNITRSNAAEQPAPDAEAAPPVVTLDDLQAADNSGFLSGLYNFAHNDGEKFTGGFGPTTLFFTDYWTLRARSRQLFTENLYARGLIRRLITNEINTGLELEALPDEQTLGLALGDLAEWAEDVENRITIWARNPELCDHRSLSTFGAIQADARQAALVEGDVLAVLRINPATQQPTVQLIPGGRITTPIGAGAPRGTAAQNIRHGVHLDDAGRHLGFYIESNDGRWEYIPARGPQSGRRVAWLVYGSDHLHDDVRGQPLLSLLLQSLKEIDRYRDSVQRKAVVNSILAMFIKKTADKPSTRPLTGGAVRRDQAVTDDGSGQGGQRRYDITSALPGMVIQELQQGEEPVGFNSAGVDLHFGQFEAAILRTVAWCNEVPPEILELSFEKNYSASQAALNEFKVYLNRVRRRMGEQFLTPIYKEWLIGQVRSGKINAPGLLEALRRPDGYDIVGAWIFCEWCGQIKPSADLLKTVRAYTEALNVGAITYSRAAREMFGTKFSRNVEQQRLELAKLAPVRAVLTAAETRATLATAEDETDDQ